MLMKVLLMTPKSLVNPLAETLAKVKSIIPKLVVTHCMNQVMKLSMTLIFSVMIPKREFQSKDMLLMNRIM